MAEKSFPFDAVEVEGIPDRVFYAEDFAKYFKQFIGNGVYPNPSNNLKVDTLNNNMVLTVRAGSAFINGYTYFNNEDMEILLNTANASYNRKDIIVVQLDLVAREIKVVYKAGTASANPLSPTLTRNSDVYELQLAEVLVRNATTQILPSDITDTRLDSARCGIVKGLIDEIDTTSIFNSYLNKLESIDVDIADFRAFIAGQETEWLDLKTEYIGWFNDAKAHTFALVNTDFQDHSTKKGYTYITDFLPNGDITETIKNKITNDILATKSTVFLPNGDIQETIVWTDPAYTVTKLTKFLEDGSIESEVS